MVSEARRPNDDLAQTKHPRRTTKGVEGYFDIVIPSAFFLAREPALSASRRESAFLALGHEARRRSSSLSVGRTQQSLCLRNEFAESFLGDHGFYAGGQSVTLKLRTIVRREQYEACIRYNLLKQGSRIQSVHRRHEVLQDDEIRIDFRCLQNCIAAVFRFGYDFIACVKFKNFTNHRAHGRIVIHNENALSRHCWISVWIPVNPTAIGYKAHVPRSDT
jgi:hypothetical protein